MKNVTKLILSTSLITLLSTISCMEESYISDTLLFPEQVAENTEINPLTNRCNVIFKESKIASANNLLRGINFSDRIAKAKFVESFKKKSIKKINKILALHAIDSLRVLNYFTTTISGITIELNKTELNKLSEDENVELIEFDRVHQLPTFEFGRSGSIIN